MTLAFLCCDSGVEIGDRLNSPVDGRDDATLGKWRGIVVLPDLAMRMVSLVRLVEGVVERRDEEEQPAHRGGNLVHEKVSRGVLITSGKDIQAVTAGRGGGFRHVGVVGIGVGEESVVGVGEGVCVVRESGHQ